MAKKIMIIAGEASGDLHGGKLVESLMHMQPDAHIFGVGGERMKSAGMELLFHVEELAFMGFTEVVKHLGDIRQVFNALVRAAHEREPDIVVLVDYPGFNLRLGKKLKKKGFKIFYFISPQVWAWRQGRAKKMAKFIDRMAVIFEFEVGFFKEYGLDARFVGHPLVDGLQVSMTKPEFFARFLLPTDARVLGLFPGSRNQEVDQLLPTMLFTARQLRQKYPQLSVAISQADTIGDDKIAEHLVGYDDILIVKNSACELMKYSSAALVASGTATLETAWFQTPFVILYKVSPISYFIGKRVVKIPFIGLANIVVGRKIIEEFIQDDVLPELLFPEIEKCLFDEKYRRRIQNELARVKQKLGAPGASDKTADLILEMISA